MLDDAKGRTRACWLVFVTAGQTGDQLEGGMAILLEVQAAAYLAALLADRKARLWGGEKAWRWAKSTAGQTAGQRACQWVAASGEQTAVELAGL